jgi:CRP/FNR family transcriptional regulator, cyclic AMP receptor protein
MTEATLQDRVSDERTALSAEELREIATHATPREFRARTVLMSEGDDTDSLYIILEGRVRAYVSDSGGREAVLSIMGPGEYFGEIAFDEGPRSASVITLEPCRMLVVAREDFADFVRRSPAFATHFIHRLIGRIRTLTDNVRSLALMDAYGRVARLLLDGSITENGVQFVPEKLTQAEIASRVGCSREMVSRIFKDLVQGDYISLERDRIVINRKPPAKW